MILNYVLGGALIALGVALQFVPLYRVRLQPWIERYRWLVVIRWRVFQLVAGFALVALGIDMLR